MTRSIIIALALTAGCQAGIGSQTSSSARVDVLDGGRVRRMKFSKAD